MSRELRLFSPCEKDEHDDCRMEKGLGSDTLECCTCTCHAPSCTKYSPRRYREIFKGELKEGRKN